MQRLAAMSYMMKQPKEQSLGEAMDDFVTLWLPVFVAGALTLLAIAALAMR